MIDARPSPWRGHLAGNSASARSVQRRVVALAEPAPGLSDERLRSWLVVLGGLER